MQARVLLESFDIKNTADVDCCSLEDRRQPFGPEIGDTRYVKSGWYLSNKIQRVTSRKTAIFVCIVVRNVHLTRERTRNLNISQRQ
jgi:hypothetical protein